MLKYAVLIVCIIAGSVGDCHSSEKQSLKVQKKTTDVVLTYAIDRETVDPRFTDLSLIYEPFFLLSQRVHTVNLFNKVKCVYNDTETRRHASSPAAIGFSISGRKVGYVWEIADQRRMSWSGLADQAQEGNSYWDELVGRISDIVGKKSAKKEVPQSLDNDRWFKDEKVEIEVDYAFNVNDYLMIAPNIQVKWDNKENMNIDSMVNDKSKVTVIGVKGKVRF
ncbi:MAG: hypothetical protein P9M13_08040 [Candidatus Ancaeobacter aquaticus]|nr:hypothetical protein [Candidatus Ancaeobacter aquaticus]